MIKKNSILVFSYRISNAIVRTKSLFFLYPLIVIYHILIRDILTFDVHEKARIDKGMVVWHGFGIAISPQVCIGRNVILRHNTTIGAKGGYAPIIGNNVDIGAQTVIIGKIRIGDNVIIGAGSVVVKDVPSNCIVAGNPAKIISRNV